MLNPLCHTAMQKKYLIVVLDKRATKHWHNEWLALNNHISMVGSLELNCDAQSFFTPCYSLNEIATWNWSTSPGLIVPIDVFNKSPYLTCTVSWSCVIVDTPMSNILTDLNTLWTFYIHSSKVPTSNCITYDLTNTLSAWIPKCYIYNMLFELSGPIQKFVQHNRAVAMAYVDNFVQQNKHLFATAIEEKDDDTGEQRTLSNADMVECLVCCEETSDMINLECCSIGANMCRSCLFRYLFESLYTNLKYRREQCALKCAFCTKRANFGKLKLERKFTSQKTMHPRRVLTQLVLIKHIQQCLEASNNSAKFLLLIDKSFFSTIISKNNFFNMLLAETGTIDILSSNFNHDKNSCKQDATFTIFCFSSQSQVFEHFRDVKLPHVNTIFLFKKEGDNTLTDQFLTSITCTNIQPGANLFIHRILI